MKIVDAKGEVCPKPLIMTKKALLEIEVGQPISILVNNETSLKNVMAYLSDQGAAPTYTSTANGVFIIYAVRPEKMDFKVNAAEYCNSSDSFVIAITSDKMGNGDDELGTILMKAFVNSIKEQEKQPSHIILYNSGVKLTLKTSGVANSLKILEDSGVRVLVCGTCVDYFDIKNEITVGMISNMYSITEVLANAGHIINP